MATIYKRGEYWQVQYRLNGKLVQHSLKTRVKRLAQLKLSELELSLDCGELGLGRRAGSRMRLFADFESEVVSKKSPPWQKRMSQ